MTKNQLKKIVDKHTTCASDYEAIWRAVEAYSSASNNGKPLVSRQLPSVQQLREANKDRPNTFLSGALYVIDGIERGNFG